MAQEILRQSNFNGGELSPQAVARRDLKAYTSSLAMCVNMIPRAEGPIVRRPGLAHIDTLRNTLAAVPVTAAMLTMPNGGDPAALVAGTGAITTTDIGPAEQVLLEIDFGAPTEVAMVDLIDFAIVAAGGALPDPTPPQYPWRRRPLSEEPL